MTRFSELTSVISSISKHISTMPGLVYLIQPPQCIGTDRYEIGMSDSTCDHETGCAIIVSRECSNPRDVWKELVKIFADTFGRPIKGTQWFSGNKNNMINSYDECFAKYATIGDDSTHMLCVPSLTLCEFVQRHVELTRDRPVIVVDRRMYELFDILPDAWFSQTDLFEIVINTIRNEPVIQENRISTIRALMIERGIYTDEWVLIRAFQSKMTGTHKKDTLARMKEIILRTSAPQFNQWQDRYNTKRMLHKTTSFGLNISYRRGAVAKLLDLNRICRDVNLSSLQKGNPEWTTSHRKACVECDQIHFQDCRDIGNMHDWNRCTCDPHDWDGCEWHVWQTHTIVHNIEIRSSGLPPAPLFRYRRGYCVKLSDLKLVQPDISEIKLLTMNPEWTASRKAICIHCKQYHARQCCSDYDASAKATCMVVDNIALLC